MTVPPLVVRALVGQQHGQWYATAPAFCVAGMGATEQAARDNLCKLLEAYLQTFYDDGRTVRDALRPLGKLAQLRLFLAMEPRKRQHIRLGVSA